MAWEKLAGSSDSDGGQVECGDADRGPRFTLASAFKRKGAFCVEYASVLAETSAAPHALLGRERFWRCLIPSPAFQ